MWFGHLNILYEYSSFLKDLLKWYKMVILDSGFETRESLMKGKAQYIWPPCTN